MRYQNLRGGRVQLRTIGTPLPNMANATLSGDDDVSDALYAMELALGLEGVNYDSLIALRRVAEDAVDFAFADFLESELLQEQVESINEISKYVAQLRRVGRGLGEFQFDLTLQD